MARLIKEAKILLKWDNGVQTEIGTLSMEQTGKMEIQTKVNVSRQRIGWNVVRMGMKLMFPKINCVEKWKYD